MALGVAAAALQGRRGLEDLPQGAGADLAAGREVVEGGDELVALVADVRGSFAKRRLLYHDLLIAFNLAFVSVQDLCKEQQGLMGRRPGDRRGAGGTKNPRMSPGISWEFLWDLLGTRQCE